MKQLPHHLAAVWFADVVGYSALSEEDEATALRVVQAFMGTTRDVVGRYGGRVVKFLGDGALAEFPSTDLAVRSAKSLAPAVSRGERGGGTRPADAPDRGPRGRRGGDGGWGPVRRRGERRVPDPGGGGPRLRMGERGRAAAAPAAEGQTEGCAA